MRRPTRSLSVGWRSQIGVIRALMLRDMMMRYGRDNVGFVWIVLEPMILTSGVMVIWTVTMGNTKYGLKLVELILTGYMPLTLWRHTTNGCVTLFRRSASLLYHRSITLYDIVIARVLLEFVATTAAFLVVWGTLYVSGLASGIASLDLLILGWCMMGWLAGATAFILAALTEISETSERFVQPIQYLTIPVSGAFSPIDWLPYWAQEAILLNPMAHCYEVFRAGYFGSSYNAHYSLSYFCSFAFALTFLGIVAIHWVRPRVQLN